MAKCVVTVYSVPTVMLGVWCCGMQVISSDTWHVASDVNTLVTVSEVS